METPQQPNHDDGAQTPQDGGSGNRRVRKRRVRAAKETMYGIELHRRTLRIRLMMVGCALLFVAALAVVAAWYPGTEGFRNRLNEMLLNSTGAEVGLENATLSPFKATAARVEASWPNGNPLASFSAEHITANVLPQRYFSRSFGGGELRAARGKLTVRYPDLDAPSGADGLAGRSRVDFSRIGIPQLDIHFGDPDMGASAVIREAEAAYYPTGPGGIPRALLYSGTLDIPYWPGLVLERAIVEFPAGRSRITSMRVRDSLPDLNGELLAGHGDITGEISHAPIEASMLELELNAFQLHALIGAEAGRFFIGRVDTRTGDDAGVIRVSKDEGLQMRADLVANERSQITFNHFPFLAFLSRALDDNWFLNPIFDEAPSMVLIRDGGDMLFDDIHFTASRRMAIRGSLSIDPNDGVAGEIEVGLAPSLIEGAIARRLDGMFSHTRENFRWITLELGGTTRVPTDNFNARFIEAPLPEIDLPETPPAAPIPQPQPDPAPVTPVPELEPDPALDEEPLEE